MNLYFVSYEVFDSKGVLKSKGHTDVTAPDAKKGFTSELVHELKKEIVIFETDKIILISVSRI